jgi:hypothetical protein
MRYARQLRELNTLFIPRPPSSTAVPLSNGGLSLILPLYDHPLFVAGLYHFQRIFLTLRTMKLPEASCGATCEILQSHYPPSPKLRRALLAFIPVASYEVFGEGK